MSDAPTAAPAAPANVSQGGQPASPPSSPVNAVSAASSANQQAAAAGEHQGLSNQDQAKALANEATQPQGVPGAEATPGEATLSPPQAFTPSGNSSIDQVTQLLMNQKFEGAQEVVNEVISNQELSLTSKAKLVDELGADIAGLVINQLETSVAVVKEAGAAEGKRLKEYAYEKFGGADPDNTWSEFQRYANSSDVGLSSTDKTSMNEMLSAGGLKAEMVIDTLFNKYKDSTGFVKQPSLMEGDKATQTGFQPMSKRDYQAEIGPAIVKFGESSQEVQSMRNRRAISISRGIN